MTKPMLNLHLAIHECLCNPLPGKFDQTTSGVLCRSNFNQSCHLSMIKLTLSIHLKVAHTTANIRVSLMGC